MIDHEHDFGQDDRFEFCLICGEPNPEEEEVE